MRHVICVAVAVVFGLLGQLSSSQEKDPNAKHGPTKTGCIADARRAVDPRWLAQRPASEINELDWKLSACEARFLPLKSEGAMLIAEGHGFAADEFRRRIEKAISRLPSELQKQVWDAFNSDAGDGTTKWADLADGCLSRASRRSDEGISPILLTFPAEVRAFR